MLKGLETQRKATSDKDTCSGMVRLCVCARVHAHWSIKHEGGGYSCEMSLEQKAGVRHWRAFLVSRAREFELHHESNEEVLNFFFFSEIF